MVVNELRGEKVDIVPFSDEPPEFVMKALSPAKVKEVRIDDSTGTAEVIVPDYQLSLAIGKEGQNARLAARLTGWRVDIKSETQLAEEEAYANQEWAEGEWVENESGELVWKPAEGGEGVSAEQWQAGEGGDAPEAAEGEAPSEGDAPAGADAPAAAADGDASEAAEAAPAEASEAPTAEEPVAEKEAAEPPAESPT
jgi:N utilization substance protein A